MAISFDPNEMLIEADSLNRIINNKDVRILDSRWYLNDKKKGLNEFKKNHIPNSVFFDLEKFSDHKSDLPHMLPSTKEFQLKISELGIKNRDKIIIYDQEGFFCSTRTWLMFKIYGHQKVLILNGGYLSWKKKFKTEKYIKSYSKTAYKVFKKNKIIFSKKEVKNILGNIEFQVIDARPKKRFDGIEAEPRKNVIRGNIQGSINIPFNSINKSGKILSNDKLKKILYKNEELRKKKIIVLCGSGVTACNIIFALHKIQHQRSIFLYDGSWSEWGIK